MTYFTTEKLLTYPPFNALLIAANDALGSSLNPKYVEEGAVLSTSGNLLTLEIVASTGDNNRLDKRFVNKGRLTVERIDLATFFEGSVEIEYGAAISSLDVARIIGERTGIVFEERDFVRSVIRPNSNKLVAAPHSLRWVGELTIERI